MATNNTNNTSNDKNDTNNTGISTNNPVTNTATTNANAAEVTFQIQRIYTKDVSFETPKAPQIFQQEWNPEVKLDIDTSSSNLAENTYEVVLRTTVTATLGTDKAFLCEVSQAGIFTVAGLEGNNLAHCLSAYCPTILFPYARECVTNLVSRGTFPQLNLAPINFDALFASYLQQQAAENTKTEEAARTY